MITREPIITDNIIDVGIDIGMRRLAYSWPSYRLSGAIDLGRQKGLSRDAELRMLQDWLITKLPVGVRLWIDQAYAQASIATAQRLSETIAAVYTAQDWIISPILVHSSTWKSQVIGNHMAGKDELRSWLEQERPDLYRPAMTEDEVDATIIGLYGKGRADGRILPPEPKKPKKRKVRT